MQSEKDGSEWFHLDGNCRNCLTEGVFAVEGERRVGSFLNLSNREGFLKEKASLGLCN